MFPYLLGNSNKIKQDLGWHNDYDWKSLLKEMFDNDMK
jgi:GDP-D-mannose dehydratase